MYDVQGLYVPRAPQSPPFPGSKTPGDIPPLRLIERDRARIMEWGGIMATFHGTIRAIHICLTATMTLVAGIPHFCCACPGRASMPSTPKSAPHPAPCCCCDGCSQAPGSRPGCCSREAPSHSEEPPSAQPDRPREQSLASSSTQRRQPKCRISESPRPEGVLPSWSGSLGGEGQASDVALPAQLDPARPSPVAAGRRMWRPHTLPPATDLVTLLQHLLI
jgi:hypothetical protein